LILAVALIAFGADKPSDKKDVVRIGVILPLSGNNSNLGLPQTEIVKMVENELARTPTKHSYKFIVEDDAMTGRMTAEAAHKLIYVDHVAAIMTLGSGAGNILSPMASNNKVIHISCGSSDAKITRGPYNYIHWVRPEEEAPIFAKIVTEKFKSKRVVFLVARQQGLMAIADACKAELIKAKVPAISIDYFNPDERDFRPYLLKIWDQKKPDLFVPMGFSPNFEIILRQNKQMKYFDKITTLESIDITDDKSDCEGMIYVSGAAPTPEFTQKIIAATGSEPKILVPYTYDILHLMVNALEQCPDPASDKKPALAYLDGLYDYQGAVGKLTVNQRIIHSPAGLYKFTNGKSVPINIDDIKPTP